MIPETTTTLATVPPAVACPTAVHEIFATLRADSEEQSEDRFLRQVDRAHEHLLGLVSRESGSQAYAQLFCLKTLNLVAARYYWLHRSSHVASRPFGLIVDPTSACALHCPGCVHTSNPSFHGHFDWRPATLEAEQMRCFLKQFAPYALAILMYSYGEPLLNPLTPSYCAAAKRYGLTTVLSTSLSFPIDADLLVASPIDRIIISIDGVTQSVYREFRRGGDLDLVLRNVADLVRARARHPWLTPHLQWQFLTFEHNVDEVARALEMAEEIGVDSLNVVTPYDVSWDDPSIRVSRSPLAGLHTFRYSPVSSPDPVPPLEAEVIAMEHCGSWRNRGQIAAGKGPGGPAAVREDLCIGHAAGGETCEWLYKNICMDAAGRIMPCACSPTFEANLVFAEDFGSRGDPFNSLLYQQARRFFADPCRFRALREKTPDTPLPACVNCRWNHRVVDVDLSDCPSMLRSFDHHGLLDEASITLLTDW